MKLSLTLVIVVLLVGCAGPGGDLGGVNPDEAPAIMTVAEWGGTPPDTLREEHEIAFITLHHGGEDFPADKDVIAYLRGLQNWSRSDKSWMDIPYHYMIDLEGNIYAARDIRFPGDTNTSYDPTGHALICVMGNYENQTLSKDQLTAVVDLSAWLSRIYEVPPDRIRGHKDYAETLCPGADFYHYIDNGTIQQMVAEKLKSR